jgi:hypothetical protein
MRDSTVKSPAAIPSEQWDTLDRPYPSGNVFHGKNTPKYFFSFGSGVINSLIAKWAVFPKTFFSRRSLLVPKNSLKYLLV